jgi:hypothetical protein
MAARCGPLTGRPSGPVGRGTAAALAEKNNDRFHEAELHRHKGELFLAESPDQVGAAEHCFLQAIDTRLIVARSSHARLCCRRASPGSGNGKAAATRPWAALAAIYGTFTEGLTTPDLVDAAALLNSLT